MSGTSRLISHQCWESAARMVNLPESFESGPINGHSQKERIDDSRWQRNVVSSCPGRSVPCK
jgi:hypothetical protein